MGGPRINPRASSLERKQGQIFHDAEIQDASTVPLAHLPGNHIDLNLSIAIHKDVDDSLKDFGLVEKATDIVKAWNPFERKVWQILGDFTRFRAVLGVLLVGATGGHYVRFFL